MKNTTTANRLRDAAAYLKETRVPVGEKNVIERLLSCALALENMAAELETEKEEKPHDADDQ